MKAGREGEGQEVKGEGQEVKAGREGEGQDVKGGGTRSEGREWLERK